MTEEANKEERTSVTAQEERTFKFTMTNQDVVERIDNINDSIAHCKGLDTQKKVTIP